MNLPTGMEGQEGGGWEGDKRGSPRMIRTSESQNVTGWQPHYFGLSLVPSVAFLIARIVSGLASLCLLGEPFGTKHPGFMHSRHTLYQRP